MSGLDQFPITAKWPASNPKAIQLYSLPTPNGDKCDHPHPMERYRDESRRLLGVLEERLASRPYLVGDEYTIADMATRPWVRTIGGFYAAGEIMGLAEFFAVNEWVERCESRPASKASLNIPARD